MVSILSMAIIIPNIYVLDCQSHKTSCYYYCWLKTSDKMQFLPKVKENTIPRDSLILWDPSIFTIVENSTFKIILLTIVRK